MKKLLILILFIFLASCATQHVFNTEKANTYLMSHIDRPAHIQEALSVGKLAQGMNEEEVKICWGKPDKIEKSFIPNHEITIWKYPEYQVVGYNNRRSFTKKCYQKQ